MDLSGCLLKIFPSLLKASKMKSKATRAEKMSLVNLVKNLTNIEPWKRETIIAMINSQTPTHTLQDKKLNPNWVENSNSFSSYSKMGPVTPRM